MILKKLTNLGGIQLLETPYYNTGEGWKGKVCWSYWG